MPSSFVVTYVMTFVATFLIDISAPETTPPDLSVMIPWIVPPATWAERGRTHAVATNRAIAIMLPNPRTVRCFFGFAISSSYVACARRVPFFDRVGPNELENYPHPFTGFE